MIVANDRSVLDLSCIEILTKVDEKNRYANINQPRSRQAKVAEAKKRKQDDQVQAGDPHDTSSYQNYPTYPSVSDQLSESFMPTQSRANLEVVRRRRQEYNKANKTYPEED